MRGDQRQGSLFGEPEPVVLAGVLPESWQADPEALYALIEERDGVPGILASKFAEWSGYVHPNNFRRHIESLKAELEQWGSCIPINQMIRAGKGARRWVRDYWLNRDQLNHALIHTRLPQLRALRALVTTVFGKYQSGKLRPVDAETEVELLEATDRVPPPVVAIGAELARREDVTRLAERVEEGRDASLRSETASLEALKAILTGKSLERRGPNSDAVTCGKWIVWNRFRALCPCCQEHVIMESKDKLNKEANWDHYKGRHKRTPEDGWFVCRKCNEKFEKSGGYREEKRPAWDNYLGHVKHFWNIKTKLDL